MNENIVKSIKNQPAFTVSFFCRFSIMGIQLTAAFAVYLLYSIQSSDCIVRTAPVVFHADEVAGQNWHAGSHAFVRAKRHSTQSRVSLIEPQSAQKKDIDDLSQRSEPSEGGLSWRGYEYDNQAEKQSSSSTPATTSASPPPTTTTANPNKPNESNKPSPGESTDSDDSKELISPLIIYLIIAGIILMMIALLVIIVAVMYIVCTIPSCDKDEDEEDACAMPKGNSRSIARPSSSFSRCPSNSQKGDEPRYSQQSVDDLMVHKSRGSSLSRQSSCRICPRFGPKSSRARASGASTGTGISCSSGGSGGSEDVAVAATPATGTKDYFISCVCDLPAQQQQYSPSVSTTTTFNRC